MQTIEQGMKENVNIKPQTCIKDDGVRVHLLQFHVGNEPPHVEVLGFDLAPPTSAPPVPSLPAGAATPSPQPQQAALKPPSHLTTPIPTHPVGLLHSRSSSPSQPSTSLSTSTPLPKEHHERMNVLFPHRASPRPPTDSTMPSHEEHENISLSHIDDEHTQENSLFASAVLVSHRDNNSSSPVSQPIIQIPQTPTPTNNNNQMVQQSSSMHSQLIASPSRPITPHTPGNSYPSSLSSSFSSSSSTSSSASLLPPVKLSVRIRYSGDAFITVQVSSQANPLVSHRGLVGALGRAHLAPFAADWPMRADIWVRLSDIVLQGDIEATFIHQVAEPDIKHHKTKKHISQSIDHSEQPVSSTVYTASSKVPSKVPTATLRVYLDENPLKAIKITSCLDGCSAGFKVDSMIRQQIVKALNGIIGQPINIPVPLPSNTKQGAQ